MAGMFENLPYTNFHELNLGWLLETVRKLAALYEDLKIEGIVNDLERAIAGNTAAIASLNRRFTALENGDYIANYIPALASWIDANLQSLVAQIAKFVQFGIDQNGYFYADIPENWDFLRFETGYDPSDPDEYLHLIINY